MRLRIAAFIALFAIATYQWADSRPLTRRPGVLAPDHPVQMSLDSADRAYTREGFRLIPRATFTATVRVLAKERYRFDTLASLSPVDLAVGWGPMSDTSVLQDLRITQGGRFYYWRVDELPVPRAIIESHSANWHIIPATRAVERALGGVREGSIVKLTGELVDIEGGDGGAMRTSLRRDDTGAGACEIVRVVSLAIGHAS